jgi:mannose/fructose/N-acetylgalactosamine-specific phosphotransferase system component IIB
VTVVLARVDDRMIHGQVVLGWGHPLRAGFIVLVDDDIAAVEWEQEIYRSAVPDSIEVIFASLVEAQQLLPEWVADPRRGILVTADVVTMNELRKAQPDLLPSINLGGIHHRPGRTERLRYVYLDSGEMDVVREMATAGSDVFAQDVPSSTKVAAKALLP